MPEPGRHDARVLDAASGVVPHVPAQEQLLTEGRRALVQQQELARRRTGLAASS